MSIYEKLVEVRKEAEKTENPRSRKRVNRVLVQLMNYAFENNDELPKKLTLETTGLDSNDLRELLENKVGLKVEDIEMAVVRLSLFTTTYDVTLI